MPELLTVASVVLVALGCVLGASVAWVVLALRGRVAVATARAEFSDTIGEAGARARAAEARLDAERERRETAEAEASRVRDRVTALAHELAVAEERADHLGRRAREQEDFLERSRRQLEQSFDSLAATALESSNRRFLDLAEQRLAAAHDGARGDLDARRKEIETLLAPLQSALGRLDARTAEIEKARVDAYARIDHQVDILARAAGSLGERATELASALTGSRTQGRWGEMALRNVVELAGMSEHCDFVEQRTTSEGTRPDLTVRLPGGRLIAVDAKAPLEAYLQSCEAPTAEARRTALDRHVAALRTHVRALASRGYAAALPGDVDLVVLFLPGEPFLAAAFARDPDLQVEALRSRVLVATPATLVALLRTVAIYWQQREIAANAEAIAATARELYERGAAFGAHLAKVGGGLRQAVEAYNHAVGSYDSRFVPMARRLEEMHVVEGAARRLDEVAAVDTGTRRCRGSDVGVRPTT